MGPENDKEKKKVYPNVLESKMSSLNILFCVAISPNLNDSQFTVVEYKGKQQTFMLKNNLKPEDFHIFALNMDWLNSQWFICCPSTNCLVYKTLENAKYSTVQRDVVKCLVWPTVLNPKIFSFLSCKIKQQILTFENAEPFFCFKMMINHQKYLLLIAALA